MKNRKTKNRSTPSSSPASPPWLLTEWEGPPVALFWDQSLVWGLICVDTLRRLQVPFRIVSGAEIGSGALGGSYNILLVPGGWAVHKMRALGESGREGIRSFIEAGGSYLGFCGGAGLALSSPPALRFVPVERMSLEARLPSASGEILVQGLPEHPAWSGIPQQIPVSIWWPSQFAPFDSAEITRLAAYEATGSDFRVSDLPVADLEHCDGQWEEWEAAYGINLDPRRMTGQPAILEARLGKGRLILSYPHLETPGDEWGNRLFLNFLTYLDREAATIRRETSESGHATTHHHHHHDHSHSSSAGRAHAPHAPHAVDEHLAFLQGHPLSTMAPGPEAMDRFAKVSRAVEELIHFGERQLLWSWRRSWLLHWQRGIRGLEYGTMAVAMRSILKEASASSEAQPHHKADDPWMEKTAALERDVTMFCRLACRLLLEEKLAFHSGNRSKLGNVNDTVDSLREQLFGSKMSHGGLCGSIMDQMDTILLHLLRHPIARDSGSIRIEARLLA